MACDRAELVSTPVRVRLPEIDFIKGGLIALMVLFHVDFTGSTRAAFRAAVPIVYSFHMPAFLLLSGYLLNRSRPLSQSLWRVFRRTAIPYLIFEPLYLILLYAASIAGMNTSNVLAELPAATLARRVLLDPLGAYWYLHTLALCAATFAITWRLARQDRTAGVILFGVAVFAISRWVPGFRFHQAVFVVLGVWMSLLRLDLPRGIWWLVPMLLLIVYPEPGLGPDSQGRIIMALGAVGVLHWVSLCSMSLLIRRLVLFVGANSVSIVVFHALFATLFKLLRGPFLRVDASGIAYALCSAAATIALSIIAAWCLDKLHLGTLLFGRPAYSPWTYTAMPIRRQSQPAAGLAQAAR